MASGLRQTAACIVNILVFETFPTGGRLVSIARADWVPHGFLVVNESVHPTGSQTLTSNAREQTELPSYKETITKYDC
jgi:hypothetical protein